MNRVPDIAPTPASRPLKRCAFACILASATFALLAFPALGGAAHAPRPKRGGTYDGHSSQQLPVEIHVKPSGKKVTVYFVELLVCEDGRPYLYSDPPPQPELFVGAKLRHARTFKWSGSDNEDLPDDSSYGNGDLTGHYADRVSGKFYSPRRHVYRRVKGRFHTHLTIRDGSGAAVHECDTNTDLESGQSHAGSVAFKAKLKRH
jgi:hypothetical protein